MASRRKLKRTETVDKKMLAALQAAAAGRSRRVALIVCNLQNDWVDGPLAVTGAENIVGVANQLREAFDFEAIVLTQELHPEGHVSFYSTHRKKAEATMGKKLKLPSGPQMLYPDHCLQGTRGADFHGTLVQAPADIVLQVGRRQGVDSKSAFEDADGKATELEDILKHRLVSDVVIVGVTTEVFVANTVSKCQDLGFDTYLVPEGTRGHDSKAALAAVNDFRDGGVNISKQHQLDSLLPEIRSNVRLDKIQQKEIATRSALARQLKRQKGPRRVALLITQLQKDFTTEDGAFPYPKQAELIAKVNEIRAAYSWALVVVCQKWLLPGDYSFQTSHAGNPAAESGRVRVKGHDIQLMPTHCIQGTEGSEIDPALNLMCDDHLFQYGVDTRADIWSLFYDMNNKATGLETVLKRNNITDVVIVGNGYETICGYTAEDARKAGFGAYLVQDVCQYRAEAVSPTKVMQSRLFLAVGVTLTEQKDLPKNFPEIAAPKPQYEAPYPSLATMSERKTALIICDMQYDFCEKDGMAYIPGAEEALFACSGLRRNFKWDSVINLQMVHGPKHVTFIGNYDDQKAVLGKPYEPANISILQKEHCLLGSESGRLHHRLYREAGDILLQHGFDEANETKSAFREGNAETNLMHLLNCRGIKEVIVVGNGYEYVVGHTAMEAARRGFKTYMVAGRSTTPVTPKANEIAPLLKEAGVQELREDEVNKVFADVSWGLDWSALKKFYADHCKEEDAEKTRFKWARRAALVVCDIQNDWISTEATMVDEGDQLINGINRLRKEVNWEMMILTQSWHPAGHVSYHSKWGPSNSTALLNTHWELPKSGRTQYMWSDHCMIGSLGADFAPSLQRTANDIILQHGRDKNEEKWSAFKDTGGNPTELANMLKTREITDIFICGLHNDLIIKETAKEAAALGLKTYVFPELTRDSATGLPDPFPEMQAAGVELIEVRDLPKLVPEICK